MDLVNTHKAISNDLLFLGRKPADLLVMFFTGFMLYAVTRLLIPLCLYLLFTWWLSKKVRYRPVYSFRKRLLYFVSPKLLAVTAEDIPFYRSVFDEKN